MELKVYVANLGRYNEGELVGSWFTPPIDEEEMAERIGLNEDYEEYAIHDSVPWGRGDDQSPWLPHGHAHAAFPLTPL